MLVGAIRNKIPGKIGTPALCSRVIGNGGSFAGLSGSSGPIGARIGLAFVQASVMVVSARALSAVPGVLAHLEEYRIRTLLELPIDHYSNQPVPKLSIESLYDQSSKLCKENIAANAKTCLDHLLIFTARSLRGFRTLPYIVVLNPAISESYNLYLKSMSLLLTAASKLPQTVEENQRFTSEIINQFVEMHADSLPNLSKGFNEVSQLLSEEKVRRFLNNHLRERITMRLIAHQYVALSESMNDSTKFVPGGKFNGTVQPLDIVSIVRKNAELVNHIFLLKYDQTVPIDIKSDAQVVFPYIEYHLDYIFSELFKNSFRSHVENNITDPVEITIVHSAESLQIRIRDKGKGIPRKILKHIFDYSFSTFDDQQGDSYKTLNSPPGDAANVVAGMGYGLPLLQNYVQCFNDANDDSRGLLSLQTYPGLGTDIYLKIAV